MAELAQHPEYIGPLREEVEAVLANREATATSCDQMILLDSFLKECQRLHPPAASKSIQRVGTCSGDLANDGSAVSAHRVCVNALELSNGESSVLVQTAKPFRAGLEEVDAVDPITDQFRYYPQTRTHVGVPSSVIQQSNAIYTDPKAFDGFRFAKLAAAGASNTKLVDLSPEYLIFGMGVHAW